MLRDGSIIDGRYRLLETIGSGGMGSVWLAEKLSTYERFAIKFIHQHALGDDSYCARFGREVQMLRGLRHPNIVDVFDWSIPEPGRQPSAYVVMELLEGEALQAVLRRRNRIPPGLMIRIMLQVLEGVAAVHAQGIVHRDLSPANIFLVRTPGPVPRVKILDFGLAKGLGHTNADSAVTQPGSVLGRAAYAAPEIFGEVELDTRADIFACGMILFRALVGRFPYRETKVDLMWAERYSDRDKTDAYPPPSRFVSDVPAALEKIVIRALRRRPSDRFPTATEMQKELLRADNLLPPAMKNLDAAMLLGAAAAFDGPPAPGPGLETLAARKGLGATLLGAPPATGPAAFGTTVRDEPAIAARAVAPTPRVGELATGPVVFGATDEDLPAEHTVLAHSPDTGVFAYGDSTAVDSSESGSGAPPSSGGSQTSAAGDLAGDVASSIGGDPPARRRPSLLRRPALLAFSAVMTSLVVAILFLVFRGGSPDAIPGRPAAGPGATTTPSGTDGGISGPPAPAETPPTLPPVTSPEEQAKPSVRPEPVVPLPIPVAVPDAGTAEAGAVAAGDAGAEPDETEAGALALAPATEADAASGESTTATNLDAEPDAGTTVAAVREAGAATAARDAGAGTTARDAGGSTAIARDAAATAATTRDAGGSTAVRDAGAATAARDTGTTTTRDAGSSTAPPPSDFLTDYETPPAPRSDAGTSAPPSGGGSDFLTTYESGRFR